MYKDVRTKLAQNHIFLKETKNVLAYQDIVLDLILCELIC